MTTTQPATVDVTRMTRAQRAALPLTADVAQAIAEQHGVCARPLAMRRIDSTTGRVDVVPVPCGSTREDQCRPCADKARRLRMVQCREGWHLEAEPVTDRAQPTEEQQDLLAVRADLVAIHAECREANDEYSCEQIAESVAELDAELRSLGVRGRLTPLDPPPKLVRRSTRRRQDAPDLPRRPVERHTIGRVFADRYRPSTFLTLTLDSYGRVDSNGAAIDPDRYDYRHAARDAIHFPALLDRFWLTPGAAWAGMCSTSAPLNHRSVVRRTSTPPSGVRFPGRSCGRSRPRPTTRCGGQRMTNSSTPTGGCRCGTRAPMPSPTPDTATPLPTWEQACEELTEPAHIVRFGAQVHVKGILGGTQEAGRHIGYLTK
jgi:Replication initiator protein, pSAM2